MKPQSQPELPLAPPGEEVVTVYGAELYGLLARCKAEGKYVFSMTRKRGAHYVCVVHRLPTPDAERDEHSKGGIRRNAVRNLFPA